MLGNGNAYAVLAPPPSKKTVAPMQETGSAGSAWNTSGKGPGKPTSFRQLLTAEARKTVQGLRPVEQEQEQETVKPSGPSKDMDPAERKAIASKFNSYIGNSKYTEYSEFLRTRQHAFPYGNQTCYFNSSKRDAPVCWLDAEWCTFAHDKQHAPPFQAQICAFDIAIKCDGKKCGKNGNGITYLHASHFTSGNRYPGIYTEGTKDEPGDESYPPADQRRLLMLTRHHTDNKVIFIRCSWNKLLSILKEDAVRLFKSNETDYPKIKFWAVKWRNCDTDPWTLVIIDHTITKNRQWKLFSSSGKK